MGTRNYPFRKGRHVRLLGYPKSTKKKTDILATHLKIWTIWSHKNGHLKNKAGTNEPSILLSYQQHRKSPININPLAVAAQVSHLQWKERCNLPLHQPKYGTCQQVFDTLTSNALVQHAFGARRKKSGKLNSKLGSSSYEVGKEFGTIRSLNNWTTVWQTPLAWLFCKPIHCEQ